MGKDTKIVHFTIIDGTEEQIKSLGMELAMIIIFPLKGVLVSMPSFLR